MKVQKCQDCICYLTTNCPFYVIGQNSVLNHLLAVNGRKELGLKCFMSEEDKMLCDLMCGEAEDEY